MFKVFFDHQIKLVLSLLVIITAVPLISSTGPSHENLTESNELKYRGAVLAHIHKIGHGYGSLLSKAMHTHLHGVGYDTVQLNTFAYMRSRKDTHVIMGRDPSMAERFMIEEIRNLKKKGFKVMLKPHIWIGGHNLDADNWRNKIDFEDPEERSSWFESYTDFILYEAQIAEKTGVEIFVVGTELVGVSKYTNEWVELIKKVREVYSGKLSYAAEGMNAKEIKFWNSLDYIGIDAYFPLSDSYGPSLEQLVEGWEKYEPEINKLSRKHGKQVIFTEIGYKSVEGTTIKPWEWSKEGEISEEEQALAFEATRVVFRDKPYLAGIFIWKYFTDVNSYERGNIPKGFTPYGKKAEDVLSSWFE